MQPHTVSVLAVQAATTTWFAPHAEQAVQVVLLVPVGEKVPGSQVAQLTSAVTVQPRRRMPGWHTSVLLQAVQPLEPPTTRATAWVDQVWPETHETQAVLEVAVQMEVWPAKHVLAAQLVQEPALTVAE